MVLAVDIGNSNISYAVFKDEAILAHWRLPTESDRDTQYYEENLEKTLVQADVAVEDIRDVVVGSVIRESADLSKALTALFKCPMVWADHRMDFGFDIEYDDPARVGIDRLLAALAGAELCGLPVIVVDLGTAITVDMVTADRRFVAGAIAPGRRMAADALHQGTSLLPRVEPGGQPSLTGRSTSECIRSGLFYGTVGLVDGLVERMRIEIVPGAHVVATGGDAAPIAQASKYIQTVNPHLVLWGLYLLYKRSAVNQWSTVNPELKAEASG